MYLLNKYSITNYLILNILIYFIFYIIYMSYILILKEKEYFYDSDSISNYLIKVIEYNEYKFYYRTI